MFYHRNIQQLAIEIFKAQKDISPSFMAELFKPKETKYQFRAGSSLQINDPRTSNYGMHSIYFLAPKIWNVIPVAIKESSTLDTFKRLIRKWIPKSCPCKLCKTYIPNIGFI